MARRYRLRIWLPDRPGALGLVASRIGAVGGDIEAVDILDRADGRAVDEFIVELPGEQLVELLRNEIHEVDGAAVEEISPADPVETSAASDDPNT